MSDDSAAKACKPASYTPTNPLAVGVSISDLALIFHKDKRTVSAALRHVTPSGQRRGYPIFDISEASRRLTHPLVDAASMEACIRKADPRALSPYLLREYWAGQLARQRFERNAANLWPTLEVEAVLTDVHDTLRACIAMFSYTVDRRTDLSEKQRMLLNGLSEGLLEGVRRTRRTQRETYAHAAPARCEAADLLVEDDGL